MTDNPLLGFDEAADYLGITRDELVRSRQRGLAPGRLGFKHEGVVMFRRADLTPPSAKAEMTPKQKLAAEATDLGIEHTSKTTAKELEALIAAHR